MNRKETSAKILRFIYLHEDKGLNSENISEASGLSEKKVNRALDDLEKKGYISLTKMMDGVRRHIELEKEGLEVAESEDRITEEFSVTLDLQVVQLEWTF